MAIRTSEATWIGTLKEGHGTMKLGSGFFEGPYTFGSRFSEDKGTNPEELIGAAHAGCYSMFLSALLTEAGFPPDRIRAKAAVHLGQMNGAPTITLIELTIEAQVPRLGEAVFQEKAAAAKIGCPVSKALAATEIKLIAKLLP